MPDNNLKNYPSSSEEVSRLLGLEADSDPTDTTQYAPATSPMPSNLPVLEGQLVVESEKELTEEMPEVSAVSQKPQSESEAYEQEKQYNAVKELEALTSEPKSSAFLRGLKKIAPYVAVFVVGLFVYYFYFTDFSFYSLLANAPKIESVSEKNNALDDLIADNSAQYQAWMKQFYFDISDESVFDPYADNSGNGLTNFQKFLLNLNPKEYDTLNLGMADGQAVVEGIDPATGNEFSRSRREIIEKYFDLEAISNKVAAGVVGERQPQVTINEPRGSRPQGQFVLGANTAHGSSGASVTVNREKVAVLDIPSLGISVPLIWTKNTKDFDKDLKNGVVHYPGTAFPGELGTSYISGHSSNYAWVNSKYNKIFASLNDLQDNQSFSITLTNAFGQKTKLNYVVKRRGEYAPNDQTQFANTSQSVVALSTCWPPGTTAKRLVVFGELTGTESVN